MKKRTLITVTVFLVILMMILGGMYLFSTKTAVKNGKTPLSFRTFIGLGGAQQGQKNPDGSLSSEFTTPGTDTNTGTEGGIGGESSEDDTGAKPNSLFGGATKRSVFTNRTLSPNTGGSSRTEQLTKSGNAKPAITYNRDGSIKSMTLVFTEGGTGSTAGNSASGSGTATVSYTGNGSVETLIFTPTSTGTSGSASGLGGSTTLTGQGNGSIVYNTDGSIKSVVFTPSTLDGAGTITATYTQNKSITDIVFTSGNGLGSSGSTSGGDTLGSGGGSGGGGYSGGILDGLINLGFGLYGDGTGNWNDLGLGGIGTYTGSDTYTGGDYGGPGGSGGFDPIIIDPTDGSSGSLGGGPSNWSNGTPGCSEADTNIPFTPEEVARLNALQSRFYAIGSTLRTDSDVKAELANYENFKLKLARYTELNNYCQSQIKNLTRLDNQRRVPTPFWHDLATDSILTTGGPTKAGKTNNPEPYATFTHNNSAIENMYDIGKNMSERALRLSIW